MISGSEMDLPCSRVYPGRGSAVESVSGDRRKHVTDSLIQDETPRGPAHLMASLRETTKCQRGLGLSTNPNVIGGDPTVRRVVKGSRSVGVAASEEQFATHLDTVQHIRQTAGLERCGRRRGGFFSKESSHNSFSVNPGPVAFGHWMESDAGPRRCNENQHAV